MQFYKINTVHRHKSCDSSEAVWEIKDQDLSIELSRVYFEHGARQV